MIGSTLIQQQLISNQQTGHVIDSDSERDKKIQELQAILMGELHKFFKPELLNRFDEVVMFEPLSQKNMGAIAKLGIEKTTKLLKEQNIGLEISELALEQLSKEGYDPIYGARPLRRLIQSAIENPIALLIIQKTFIAGDTILIDYNQQTEDYTFNKKIQTQSSQNQNPTAPPPSASITQTIPQNLQVSA